MDAALAEKRHSTKRRSLVRHMTLDIPAGRDSALR
jgi:hypothetical protein